MTGIAQTLAQPHGATVVTATNVAAAHNIMDYDWMWGGNSRMAWSFAPTFKPHINPAQTPHKHL